MEVLLNTTSTQPAHFALPDDHQNVASLYGKTTSDAYSNVNVSNLLKEAE